METHSVKLIDKIEISYLRSLYSVNLEQVNHLNILSGKNDIGKSNVVKALNLFFNGEVDWQIPFDFESNFSSKRRKVAQDTNSQQTIWIAITFARPETYKNSLPPKLRVRRLWNLDGKMSQTDDLETRLKQRGMTSITETKARGSLNRLLNRIRFEYVPAVKDKRYFQHILSNLQQALIREQDDNDLADAAVNLNKNIADRTQSLKQEFERLTKISTEIELPTTASSLLRMAGVVKAGEHLLTMRGDGIQASYISTLLNYISTGSSNYFIWGFEEPENSLEYTLATEVAKSFQAEYAETAQIFITSHSPAFVSLKASNVSVYRVHKDSSEDEVKVETVADNGKLLASEMGIINLAQQIHETYVQGIAEIKALEEKAKIADQLTRPTVFVEGDNDVRILSVAWKKLFSSALIPFDIKSCDTTDGEKGGSGGAETLRIQLEAVRADSANVILGIFDRDKKGLQTLNKLSATYDVPQKSDSKIA